MAWSPDYVTVSELAAFVRILDNADDSQLGLAISAASRAVDRHCNRQFGLVGSAEARYYTPRYNCDEHKWYVEIDDLMTTTGLLVAFDSDEDDTFGEAVTDYVLRPRNAAAKGRPWTEMVFSRDVTLYEYADSIRVTANYGWTAVPSAIKEATMLQASRIFMRRNAPFGVAGSTEMGSDLRLLSKVDPDVEVILADYIRWWGAV